MTSQQKKKKRKFTFNIGTFIFSAFFLYMIVTVFLYFTADHIQPYLVTEGPLAQNKIYTAIALREEEVIHAPADGTITYYARENTKVAKSAPVFSLGEKATSPALDNLTEKDYARVRTSMADFATSFQEDDYADLYNYKFQLAGTLLQYSTLQIDLENGMAELPEGQTLYGATQDGILLYTLDGYENTNLDDISNKLFQQKNYKTNNLKGKTKVTTGNPVYKLITDEKWSIVLPISSEDAVHLGERKNIKVRFLKDGNTQMGSLQILANDNNEFFCKVTFWGGMIRYAADRFLDIELVTNTQSGLKIPLSSIVTKDFYIIPKEYIAYNEEEGEAGFTKKIPQEKEEDTSEFVKVTLYEEDESYYYVDKNDFQVGDEIIKPDSQQTYKIEKTKPLKGVYSMNKGYAVFRKIILLDQNDEYCIVKTGTPYGIAPFDHIVKDGSSVSEEEVLYK